MNTLLIRSQNITHPGNIKNCVLENELRLEMFIFNNLNYCIVFHRLDSCLGKPPAISRLLRKDQNDELLCGAFFDTILPAFNPLVAIPLAGFDFLSAGEKFLASMPKLTTFCYFQHNNDPETMAIFQDFSRKIGA